jgi:hypothetical protein
LENKGRRHQVAARKALGDDVRHAMQSRVGLPLSVQVELSENASTNESTNLSNDSFQPMRGTTNTDHLAGGRPIGGGRYRRQRTLFN